MPLLFFSILLQWSHYLLLCQRLEPWIHYIPIARDFSDLDNKVTWMIQHQSEARRISYRASLWVKDLVFHPQAAKDEEAIFRGILHRYAKHFNVIALR